MMKKSIILFLLVLSSFLCAAAQEQPAEYYAMKYFPYSPYGVSIEQLEAYFKKDSAFTRDNSVQLPHIVFRYTSKSIPSAITGADSLCVFFTKSKLIKGIDTLPILTYDIIFFFPKAMSKQEIKKHVGLVRLDFRKKYVYSFEMTGKMDVKPKPRIFIIQNSKYSTGDITIIDGVLKSDPTQYFLNLSVTLLPEDEVENFRKKL
jgi:hypothetical protein